ncbi:membrane protein [Capnocytophaga stomatis]|uniref:LrgB family protein n=1 Tax=Capnocytophaga stomatis TaxID=1848904 RepID=UPI0019504C57|nr:LrgB family protein [Capnocytophaga stomatis]GIJ96212.1 membrane protein [Capnocytophaga stomatis]
MNSFLENPLLLLGLTFAVYYLTQMLQKKYKSALLSPVLVTTAVLIGYLSIFNISHSKYEEAGVFIEFWLKPSIVALGVPLYLQISKIKKQLIPLLVCQFIGSLAGIFSVCLVAKLFGADKEIILSLVPKSVTTPIAIEISEVIGGITPLTVASVIITGVLGSVFGFKILDFFRVKSPMGRGIAIGTASHGLGVMAAFGLSEKHAVYASLGMILNGVFTAILAPPVIQLVEPWL